MDLFTVNKLSVMSGADPRTVKAYMDKVEPRKQTGRSKYYSIDQFAIGMMPFYANQSDEIVSTDPKKMKPADQAKYYDARLKETELAKREGELCPREEVLETISTAYKALALSVDIIPDLIELHCGLDSIQRGNVMAQTAKIKDNLYHNLVEAVSDW